MCHRLYKWNGVMYEFFWTTVIETWSETPSFISLISEDSSRHTDFFSNSIRRHAAYLHRELPITTVSHSESTTSSLIWLNVNFDQISVLRYLYSLTIIIPSANFSIISPKGNSQLYKSSQHQKLSYLVTSISLLTDTQEKAAEVFAVRNAHILSPCIVRQPTGSIFKN